MLSRPTGACWQKFKTTVLKEQCLGWLSKVLFVNCHIMTPNGWKNTNELDTLYGAI